MLEIEKCARCAVQIPDSIFKQPLRRFQFSSWPGPSSRPSTSFLPKRSQNVEAGTRLRRGFDGLFSVPGPRSFSEGGKAGHDELATRREFRTRVRDLAARCARNCA